MQWFRSRVRLGSWVALFALALQLVLTFGHVHLDSLPGSSSTRIEASAGGSLPAGDDGRNAADDYCALCALTHLAGTLLPASPVALPLPLAFAQSRCPEPGLCFVLPARRSTSFTARAPPLA
jgi:hypothetical protein